MRRLLVYFLPLALSFNLSTAIAADRPLHAIESLQITPRVASTTRESRSRSAWAVARRIDELLSFAQSIAEFRGTGPGEPLDLSPGTASS